ncbi:MAG: 2-oxoglutarate dehydrogenase E1 component, partial [Hyphomicrobiales bacterium]|nr:2-oxoglutarate dehydrogenase E1 component [Hyphomicrobiales bacterium]
MTTTTPPSPATAGDSLDFESTSFLYGANASALGEIYERFCEDPESVDEQWRSFFDSLGDLPDKIRKEHKAPSWGRSIESIIRNGEAGKADASSGNGASVAANANVHHAILDSIRAIMMIRAYRIRGHLVANLDPLQLTKKSPHPELDPASYGFTEEDHERPIFINNVLGLEYANLREILAILHHTYCGNLAVEFMHISSPEEKAWIQERIEGKNKEISFTEKGKRAILSKLIQAEGFEKFLNLKYTGTKRFG